MVSTNLEYHLILKSLLSSPILSHKRVSQKFNLKNGQELEFNPVMKVERTIAEVVITTNTRQNVDGVTQYHLEMIRTIKGAQPGIENILKDTSRC
jgi:hypothetical protein